MAHTSHTPVDGRHPPATARERAQARAAALQARATQIAERAQKERGRRGWLDALFEMADRDAEVGGGIMAGALAYRLFIWLLPLALVLIAGLGIAADTADVSPSDAASSMGLAGVVSSSVAGSARSSARWYALLVGVPMTLYMTRSILRTLNVIHRLVWTDLRDAVPKPTLKATCILLAGLLLCATVSGVANGLRADSLVLGILATLLIPLPTAAVWLLISTRLPHCGVAWQNLLPGALVFGVGLELLHAVSVYVIAPQIASKQGTYGTLGTAAGLLLGLFFVSRLVVATAVTNATLWERGGHAPGER